MGDGGTGFPAEKEALLAAVLDEIVPPSPGRGLPGAGLLVEGGLLADVLRRLPDMRLAIEFALDGVSKALAARGAARLADLAPGARRALVEELNAVDGTFAPLLLFLVSIGYYRDPGVLGALGFEARPPHPGGYPMGPDDPSLLEPVRRRGKFFRDA